MSDQVVFEGEVSNNVVGNIHVVPGAPTGVLLWLTNNGVVKNAKQAEQFMLVITIVFLVLTGVFCIIAFWHPSSPRINTPVGQAIRGGK